MLRVGAAILTVALALMFAYYLYFEPHLKKIRYLKTRESEMLKAVRMAEDKGWGDVQGLKQTVAQVEALRRDLRKDVPDYLDIPGVVVKIARLALAWDVRPVEASRGISIGAPEKKQGYTIYLLEMWVSGSPEGVYGFLAGLQDLGRLTQIKELDLNTVAAGELECRLKMVVYVLGTPGEDPKDHDFMNYSKPHRKPYQVLAPGLP